MSVLVKTNFVDMTLEERLLEAQQVYEKGERVLCVECGLEFAELVSHLKLHNLNTLEYRKKYGLSTCSKKTSSNKSRAHIEKKLSKEHATKIKEALSRPEVIAKRSESERKSHRTLEYRAKVLGRETSKVTRDRMSRAHKGKISPNKGKKFSEKHRENLSKAHRNPSKEIRIKYANNARGKVKSKETRDRLSKSLKGRVSPLKGRTHTKETCEKISQSLRLAHSSFEMKSKDREQILRLIREGRHNWIGERPCNNPTERVLDLALVSIFYVDTNHNFRSYSTTASCREFQLDFVSYLLRFNVEADESDHKKRKTWDDERDKFIEDSEELDFIHRYSIEQAITDLIGVVKKIYELANYQREKYKLYDSSILVYDERWNSYYKQMQELLKEWFLAGSNSLRFKIFRDKKREIDKQWFWLLEEERKKYDSNFAIVYREILEKDLKLSFKNVTSFWRKEIEAKL